LQDEIPHIQVQEPVVDFNDDSPDEVVESLSNNLSSIKLEAI
jgi:charged multivesicular body protein 7